MLRNKHSRQRGRPVLFVHGATYPGSVMFDYPIEGVSWLDWMAGAGFDAWCIDLLGYGEADRPTEMAQPAELSAPLVETRSALIDVIAAVKFIAEDSGYSAVDLVGYSWGSAICGELAATESSLVRRLVLAGALWLLDRPAPIDSAGKLGGYRTVGEEAILKRWTTGLNQSQVAQIGSAEQRLAWTQSAIASDPQASQHQPALLRAPSGVIRDLQRYWAQGQATYAPSTITCPTLVVVGEWDHETSPEQGRAVFAELSAAEYRRYSVIGAATHSMLLERQRFQLYHCVRDFIAAEA